MGMSKLNNQLLDDLLKAVEHLAYRVKCLEQEVKQLKENK